MAARNQSSGWEMQSGSDTCQGNILRSGLLCKGCRPLVVRFAFFGRVSRGVFGDRGGALWVGAKSFGREEIHLAEGRVTRKKRKSERAVSVKAEIGTEISIKKVKAEGKNSYSNSKELQVLTSLPTSQAGRASLSHEFTGSCLIRFRNPIIHPRYISYGVLSRNSVPCSQRGRVLLQRQTWRSSQLYTRGYSAITCWPPCHNSGWCSQPECLASDHQWHEDATSSCISTKSSNSSHDPVAVFHPSSCIMGPLLSSLASRHDDYSLNEWIHIDACNIRIREMVFHLAALQDTALHKLVALVHDSVKVADRTEPVHSTSRNDSNVKVKSEQKRIVASNLFHLENDHLVKILWTLEPLTLQNVFPAMVNLLRWPSSSIAQGYNIFLQLASRFTRLRISGQEIHVDLVGREYMNMIDGEEVTIMSHEAKIVPRD
ncbi:hypothetical protein CK203_090306 [Vitis vinifera]|uniref:Uncharacterized protein n=1 Tax=Vitis vinifera TaxID=29760 RepID=A0A438DS99_VITVI|nr:hypothetical protein CK203_090306 [Vitis vinifera]